MRLLEIGVLVERGRSDPMLTRPVHHLGRDLLGYCITNHRISYTDLDFVQRMNGVSRASIDPASQSGNPRLRTGTSSDRRSTTDVVRATSPPHDLGVAQRGWPSWKRRM